MLEPNGLYWQSKTFWNNCNKCHNLVKPFGRFQVNKNMGKPIFTSKYSIIKMGIGLRHNHCPRIFWGNGKQ